MLEQEIDTPTDRQMKIKTPIGTTGEWNVEVHTSLSQYKEKGKYYSFCFLKNYRGEAVRLVSRYSIDEQIASNFHQELCQKAQELFDLI